MGTLRLIFGETWFSNAYWTTISSGAIKSKRLVGGWPTPLKNMEVSWDHYSPYMEFHKQMFQTTNQRCCLWLLVLVWWYCNTLRWMLGRFRVCLIIQSMNINSCSEVIYRHQQSHITYIIIPGYWTYSYGQIARNRWYTWCFTVFNMVIFQFTKRQNKPSSWFPQ